MTEQLPQNPSSDPQASTETSSPLPPPTGAPYAPAAFGAQGASAGAASAGANPAGAASPGTAAAAPGKPPVSPRKVKKQTPIWLIVIIIVAGVVLLGGLVSCSVSGGTPGSRTIGVIDLDGTIGQDGGANYPEGLLSQLQAAENDPMVAAVVLRVNSGGGTAAAGEEMAAYIADFSKPIVVSTASANASAAYLISSQADYIFANEASSVGAIGTAMQLTDYSKLLDLLGIDVRTITSAKSKDASYGHRPLTDEEVAYFQDQVDQINQAFIDAVAEGRGMEVAEVEELATGMAFTGTDALENGLIDEIGTYKDACNKAAALAGVSSYRIDYLNNDEIGVLDLLAALLASSGDASSATNLTLKEGAELNGQFS